MIYTESEGGSSNEASGGSAPGEAGPAACVVAAANALLRVARLKAGRRRDPSPRRGMRDASDAPLSPRAPGARSEGRDAKKRIEAGLARQEHRLTSCRTATHSAADSGLARSRLLPPVPLPTRPAPDLADRLDLIFNVEEDGPVTVSLQPLVNERPKHHLKAHRALEFAHRLSGEDPSPV